jgi:predicted Zn-ribbon and HTH transcriptional regulator
MKKKYQEPFVPVARQETVRQKIAVLLEGNTLSARDLSVEIGISEKDVYEHLEHLQRSISQSGHRFVVVPAVCRKCNFVFRKRERLKKPGKCPVCRGESIQEPLFSVNPKSADIARKII